MQYHTKGEFQPKFPIVSSGQAYQPEETESENFQQSVEESSLDESEPTREEEEAYVPPVPTNPDAEKGPEPQTQPQPQYSAWDASRSGLPSVHMSTRHTDISQSPTTVRLSTRSFELSSNTL